MSDSAVLRLPHLDDDDPWLTIAAVKRALRIRHRTQAVRLIESGALPLTLISLPTWPAPRRCVRRSAVERYAESYGIELVGGAQ